MALTLTVPPTVEPITLDQAIHQTRATSARERSYLGFLIEAVRDRAELATQRQIMTATYRLLLDGWPCEGWIDVPRPPLRTVTSIQYMDTAGVLQTLATSVYTYEAPAGPRCARGRITLQYGQSWPSVLPQAGAIVIEFTAGYGGTPDDVPPLLRKAMLTDLASCYEHREDVITGTISSELPRSSTSVYRSFKSHARQRRFA
ncbi:MAG: hypothetical protein AB7R67_21820 [Vicinamibacterales bacterium]